MHNAGFVQRHLAQLTQLLGRLAREGKSSAEQRVAEANEALSEVQAAAPDVSAARPSGEVQAAGPETREESGDELQPRLAVPAKVEPCPGGPSP